MQLKLVWSPLTFKLLSQYPVPIAAAAATLVLLAALVWFDDSTPPLKYSGPELYIVTDNWYQNFYEEANSKFSQFKCVCCIDNVHVARRISVPQKINTSWSTEVHQARDINLVQTKDESCSMKWKDFARCIKR